jgi:hypothetical protein
MKRNVAIAIAAAILVVSGLVHGLWAERWSPSPALQAALGKVDLVPLEAGDWKGQVVESDASAFAQAGAQAYWTRSYVHTRKKTALLAILMCGRAGRMSVHTPEMCYGGAGYEMGGSVESLTVKAEEGTELGTFWTARFSKHGGVAADLRLYWAWSAIGPWQASANPRWQYGGEPFLYKLYLSHGGPGLSSPSNEAVLDFMRQFLPELHRTLFDRNTLPPERQE